MKQHITIQQWDEITMKQKFVLDDYGCKNDWRMSIGQMIEFLGNKWWLIICYHSSFGDTALRRDNLCDALWESVKYKLSK